MTTNDKQNLCDDLMHEAYDLIEFEEYDKALAIADRLEQLRYTGAFEIRALVYGDQADYEQAIAVLEEAVDKFPALWRFWNMLGNYYSDMEKYDKAFEMYEAGLKCESTDFIGLQFNYALALLRQRDTDTSLAKLAKIYAHPEFKDVDTAMRLRCHALSMSNFNCRKEFRPAIAYFEKLEINDQAKFENGIEWARVLYELAYAHANLQQEDVARDLILSALQFDKHNTELQYLLRELRNDQDYEQAQYYRIMVDGRWHGPIGDDGVVPGFLTSYDVVADSVEEAMEFIKEFEPREVRDSLSVEECEILESEPQPKGVYETNGYSFYDEE